MAEIKVTNGNFDKEVLSAGVPVLVDFWAPWCMPCRMIAPIVEEIADETAGKAVVGKVNIDEEAELAARFRVTSIPTLIVFEGGKEVRRSVGSQGKDALKKLLGV